MTLTAVPFLVAHALSVSSGLPQSPSYEPSSLHSARAAVTGVAVYGSVADGRYDGRRIFIRGTEIQISPSDKWTLWLGQSDATAFGKSTDSRLRSHSEQQSIRYRIGERKGLQWALQYDRIRPQDGVVNSDSDSTVVSAIYDGPRIDSAWLIGSKGAYDASVGMSVVHSPGGHAQVYQAGAGYRTELTPRLTGVGQVRLGYQRWHGPVTQDGSDLKLTLRGQLRYLVAPHAELSFVGTLFLTGIPFDDALGSYLIYEPGISATQGLQKNVVGYGSIGLSLAVHF